MRVYEGVVQGMRLLVSDFPWTSQITYFRCLPSDVWNVAKRPIGVNAATDVSTQLSATLTSTYGVTLDWRSRPQQSQKNESFEIEFMVLHYTV